MREKGYKRKSESAKEEKVGVGGGISLRKI